MAIDMSSMLTNEEQLLLKRCDELYSRADNGVMCCSDFLNLRERFIIENHRRIFFSDDDSLPLCIFYGGYPSAERTILCFFPSYTRYVLPAPSQVAVALSDELDDTDRGAGGFGSTGKK